MKIYVASSWRNDDQPHVVDALRSAGHEVYDFRHPTPGNDGFSWSEIDPNWQQWTAQQYRVALKHPIAQAGFRSDFSAMQWADAGVLVMPCGRSAHLEAGWFIGQGKPLFTLLSLHDEPELMRAMDSRICLDLGELIEMISREQFPERQAAQKNLTEAQAAAYILADCWDAETAPPRKILRIARGYRAVAERLAATIKAKKDGR